MINTLLKAGYTLQEIAEVQETTVLQLRRANPELPLCNSTIASMAADLEESGYTQAQMCRKYNVNLAKFKQLYYTLEVAPPAHTIANCLRAGNTQQQARAILGCKTGDIKAERDKYILELLKTRKYTQDEIAQMLGCSRGTVSHLSPTKSTIAAGKRLTEEEWNSIISDLKTQTNITQLAKKHCITRNAIYNHIRRSKRHAQTLVRPVE